MTGVKTITVIAEDDGIRLDRWFKRHFPELAHGRLEKLLRTGQVKLDGKRAHSSDRVAAGQVVRVPPLGAPGPAPAPRPAPVRPAV
jgi:23S rRNA pseudouridine955/2504/2580 synthase